LHEVDDLIDLDGNAVEQTLLGSGGEGDGDEGVPSRVAARTAARLGAAQQEIEELKRRLEAAEAALAERDASIDDLEHRHRLEKLLIEAGAIDLEAATLLAMVATGDAGADRGGGGAGGSALDAEAVVEALREQRPFLFERRSSRRSGAGMAGAGLAQEHAGLGSLERAAEEAASSGDRGALLRYLRLRRGG
jgi:hypothetical protein